VWTVFKLWVIFRKQYGVYSVERAQVWPSLWIGTIDARYTVYLNQHPECTGTCNSFVLLLAPQGELACAGRLSGFAGQITCIRKLKGRFHFFPPKWNWSPQGSLPSLVSRYTTVNHRVFACRHVLFVNGIQRSSFPCRLHNVEDQRSAQFICLPEPYYASHRLGTLRGPG